MNKMDYNNTNWNNYLSFKKWFFDVINRGMIYLLDGIRQAHGE